MSEKIRIVVLGTGQMGAGIITLLLQKHGLELAGVYGRRPSRGGLDVGMAIGLEKTIGVPITNDLHGLLRTTRPHVVIQATCSRVVEAVDEITAALHQRANVISLAEEMAYPAYQSPHLATAMHRLAVANQVTVVGTGINPGFVLDTLVIALTGVCRSVTSITAQRINDLSPYGPTVLRSQGVGLTPAETQQVPLEMKVKGFLVRDASIGEAADIVTPAGRTLTGTLTAINPAYTHTYGPPISELSAIGGEVRAILRARGKVQ